MRKDTPDIPTHLVKDGVSLYRATGPFLRKFSILEKVELDEYYLKNNWLITIPKITVKALYRLGKFIDNAFIKENAIKLIFVNIFSPEKIKSHIKLDATINDI